MTDIPPLAAAGPLPRPSLPPFLLNCSLTDLELDFLSDAAGNKVEPTTMVCSRIRGFDMRRLPIPELRSFCMLKGLIVPDDATHSSLLVALARKKMESLSLHQAAARTEVNLDPDTSSEEDGLDESDPANQLTGTPPE
jgi:hypothetical protein